MVHLNDLTQYLSSLLSVNAITDYCPNGLQVCGRENVKKIVSGVSVCQLLLDQAVKLKADAILVHHGFFWRQEDPCITGIKYSRMKTLLQHEIALLAYHLPLDVHPELGNNAKLAEILNIQAIKRHKAAGVEGLLFSGEFEDPLSGMQLGDHVQEKLNRSPTYIPGLPTKIKTVAWCSGAAHSVLPEAVALGVDAFITGELSEASVHFARESGIHLFGAGHHATERFGVIALGEHLARQFDLVHENIDIDNPV